MRATVGDYELLETLGEGTVGKVRRAVHRPSGNHYAIKVMNKSRIRHLNLTLNVRREIAIMRALTHPNIVSLHTVLSSATHLYVVLDLVPGADLFTLLADSPRPFSEPVARAFFQQLVDGLHYCHKRGVAHRDLKPENLLVQHDGLLKITDFGISSMKGAHTTSELLTTQCGTPHYIAPEIISRANPSYDGHKVDIWSCGIILFVMLAGKLPFEHPDLTYLFETIQIGRFDFPDWISAAARDLIWSTLAVDPNTRASLAQVMSHPWFVVDYHPTTSPTSATLPKKSVISTTARTRKRKKKKRRADLPALHLSLPDSQIPKLVIPACSRPSATASAASAANSAAITTCNELLRSGRSMSFTKRSSLVRCGIVTYADVKLPSLDRLNQPSLGGIEQAKMRGILSVNSADFCDSHSITTSQDASEHFASSTQLSIRSSFDSDFDDSQQTVTSIRNLRTTISMRLNTSEADLWHLNPASHTQETILQKSTLISLKRLRSNLKQYDDELETTAPMPAPQRLELLRLLQVWETRIISDTAPLTATAHGTALSGEELQSFQSLLLAWETQLEGEEILEEVLIPGSEMVEDEEPTSDIPIRFMEQRKHLKIIIQNQGQSSSPSDLHAISATMNSNSKNSASSITNSPSTAERSLSPASLEDLNLVWNRVLAAKASNLTINPQSETKLQSPLRDVVLVASPSAGPSKDASISPITDYSSSRGSEMSPNHERNEDPFQTFSLAENEMKEQEIAERRTLQKSMNLQLDVQNYPGEKVIPMLKPSSAQKYDMNERISKSVAVPQVLRRIRFVDHRPDDPQCKSPSSPMSVRQKGSHAYENNLPPGRQASNDQEDIKGSLKYNRICISWRDEAEADLCNFSTDLNTSAKEGINARSLSSTAAESQPESKPSIVRSCGQRRIQTDLAPETVPLEILYESYGLVAFAKRICRHGQRKSCSTLDLDDNDAVTRSKTDVKISFGDHRKWRGGHRFFSRFLGFGRHYAGSSSDYDG